MPIEILKLRLRKEPKWQDLLKIIYGYIIPHNCVFQKHCVALVNQECNKCQL